LGREERPSLSELLSFAGIVLKTRLCSMENKISKCDLAILASVFVGLFWIEHGHRVHIGIDRERAAISSSANLGMSGVLGVPID
jgi:hypothetical protein